MKSKRKTVTSANTGANLWTILNCALKKENISVAVARLRVASGGASVNTTRTSGVNVLYQLTVLWPRHTHFREAVTAVGKSFWKVFWKSIIRLDREVHVKSVSRVTLMHSVKQLRHSRRYVINNRGSFEKWCWMRTGRSCERWRCVTESMRKDFPTYNKSKEG